MVRFSELSGEDVYNAYLQANSIPQDSSNIWATAYPDNKKLFTDIANNLNEYAMKYIFENPTALKGRLEYLTLIFDEDRYSHHVQAVIRYQEGGFQIDFDFHGAKLAELKG